MQKRDTLQSNEKQLLADEIRYGLGVITSCSGVPLGGLKFKYTHVEPRYISSKAT